MQINRVQNSANYAPNFQSLKHFKLPTKEVLECATGKISQETLENPKGMLKIFSKLYDIPMKNLADLQTVPLGLNIYTFSSGTIIKANNPEIFAMSKRIVKLPKTLQQEEINRIIQRVGSQLDITIDDNIKAYKTIDGEIVTIKRNKEKKVTD